MVMNVITTVLTLSYTLTRTIIGLNTQMIIVGVTIVKIVKITTLLRTRSWQYDRLWLRRRPDERRLPSELVIESKSNPESVLYASNSTNSESVSSSSPTDGGKGVEDSSWWTQRWWDSEVETVVRWW